MEGTSWTLFDECYVGIVSVCGRGGELMLLFFSSFFENEHCRWKVTKENIWKAVLV